MTKVENALDAINSRLDTAKEKISELETQQQELSKMKHRKKLGKKKRNSISDSREMASGLTSRTRLCSSAPTWEPAQSRRWSPAQRALKQGGKGCLHNKGQVSQSKEGVVKSHCSWSASPPSCSQSWSPTAHTRNHMCNIRACTRMLAYLWTHTHTALIHSCVGCGRPPG